MTISFDKFSGCLLGECLGDALGFPVEGHPAGSCVEYLQSKVKPIWDDPGAAKSSTLGQYTDDSQMARELLASLTAAPQFDAQDYIRRLLPLFASGKMIVPGLACIDAMRRIESGVPWEKAGCPPPRAGNGTAMRAAPVGMCYFDRPEEIVRIARLQGWITHRDPCCDAGSIAIAGAVALAFQGIIEPMVVCDKLAEWMSVADAGFAELVRQLPEFVNQSPDNAVGWMRTAGMTPGTTVHWPGISPFVIGTVLWSLYCFLHSPTDYYASVWTAIAVGGDVDTTAAITGAISGAYNGASVLPMHLMELLHDQNEWRLRDLEALCYRAYEAFYA